MNFNAAFSILGYSNISGAQYEIDANILDYTGTYSSLDINVGDMIFVNGTEVGNPLVIGFRIDTIVDKSTPPFVKVRATCIFPENGPFDPTGEAIVGKPDSDGVIDVPDPTTFTLSTVFTNAVRNYLVSLISSGVDTVQTNVDTVQQSLTTLQETLNDDVMLKTNYDPDSDGVITGETIGVVDGGTF